MINEKEEKYRREIVKKMKAIGTYNVSFIYSIQVLAKVLADYEATTEQFQNTGGNIVVKYTNKGGSTNVVKNPLYLAIEKLRDDIINYSKELGLTPAGLKRIKQELNNTGKKTKLEEVLAEIKSGKNESTNRR